MKALVGGDSGGYRLADDIHIPVPKPGTMLCRVHAVALSPYDAKIVDYSNTPGAVGGCDFAGIVVEVGEGVTRFEAGDRVLAVTFGLNPSDKAAGAFAEYALATEDLSCHVPDDLSLTQASSLGLGIATAGLALFQAPGLQLVMPRSASADQDTSEFVLVSGGATGTGTMATQLLKIAGYTPIVTCSPANNALCESYGAAACFDYHSATCGADIREYTANSLTSVLDCVTDVPTMKMCYDAIGSSGGKYVALESITPIIKYTRRDIRADWLMAPSIMGTPVELPGTYGRPSILEHRRFGSGLFLLVERLLQEGAIKNHPLEVREGGLARIPACVNDLRVGNVRAKRQVVSLLGG
ncbi:alcohol dehydrogenase GroES-like domain-containing protein [Lophiotrema nucula]|uniref:Alcohol dehydrogenase GroES-like domain-containing protein n=1 Tax=Lophiotrema nucula TaxID=690887 RepID=A0A6A5ZWU8_9PLEO|nr:alcohol dehydrogenase GroES-like domain-containing protein [Lophiotrema nucula]